MTASVAGATRVPTITLFGIACLFSVGAFLAVTIVYFPGTNEVASLMRVRATLAGLRGGIGAGAEEASRALVVERSPPSPAGFPVIPDSTHRAIIVPRGAGSNASLWGASDPDGNVVLESFWSDEIIGPIATGASAPVPVWSPDVSVWSIERPRVAGQSTGAFDSFLPGLAAALSGGATTIVVSRSQTPAGLRAPGLVFPTTAQSLVPRARCGSESLAPLSPGLVPDVTCRAPRSAAAEGPAEPLCQLPPNPATEPPARNDGTASDASCAADDTSEVLGTHFLTARRRAARPTLRLCSEPVLAVVQYGLCQASGGTTPPPGPAADRAAFAPLSTPLDDQATAITLPSGVPPPALLADGAGGTVRAAYGGMAVHASLAWMLLAVLEPAGAGAGGRVGAVLHAALAALGHTAVVLPPGRLCGDADRAVGLGREQQQQQGDGGEPAGEGRSSLDPALLARVVASLKGGEAEGGGAGSGEELTVDVLIIALLESPAVVSALALRPEDGALVHRWLRELHLMGYQFPRVGKGGGGGSPAAAAGAAPTAASSMRAFLASASSTTKPWAAPQQLTVPAPLAEPSAATHLRHCFVDGAYMRDVVLVLFFNQYLPSSPSAAALLLSLYAPAFPALAVTGPPESSPAHNQIHCRVDYDGPEYAGKVRGLAMADCVARGIAAHTGHLGFLLVQDDDIAQPWAFLRVPTDTVWANFHMDIAVGENPPHCFWGDAHIGGKKLEASLAHARPRDTALLRARANSPGTKLTCSFIDAVMVPGMAAADAVRLSELFFRFTVGSETALSNVLSVIRDPHDWYVLETLVMNSGARAPDRVKAHWASHFHDIHPVKLSDVSLQDFAWARFAEAYGAGALLAPIPRPPTAPPPPGAIGKWDERYN